jgi:hypothetical protein
VSVRSTVRDAVRPVVGDRVWRTFQRADRRLRVSFGRGSGAGGAPPPNDLCALATRYKTDKWGVHRYAQHYQRHLEKLRHQPIKVLEIGVGGYKRPGEGGASLRMWKHYFPHAEIFGLDLEDKSHVDEARIRTFVGDQSDPVSLRSVAAEVGRLDVIIDDGSHRSPHVITTFATLFPLLAADGIYAIEDVQSSYWPEWQGSEDRRTGETTMNMVKDLVDGLNYEEFVDAEYDPTYTDRHVIAVHCYHNLVIVEKGLNTEGTNKRRVLKGRYAPVVAMAPEVSSDSDRRAQESHASAHLSH